MSKADLKLGEELLNELERLHDRVFNDHPTVATFRLGPESLMGDVLIERAFRRWCSEFMTGVGFIGEETGAEPSAFAWDQTLLFVDPIDGTRRLMAGADDYSLTFALARNGRLVLGGISLPRLGERLVSAPGTAVAQDASRYPILAVSSRLQKRINVQELQSQGLDVQEIHSTAGRLLQLATGRIAGVVKPVGWRDNHPRLWGSAAGLIACAAAGQEIWYDQVSHLLCVATPGLAEGLAATFGGSWQKMDLDEAYRVIWRAPALLPPR